VPFRSLLFGEAAVGIPADDRTEPLFFRDLNLDQIIASVTAGKEAYDLTPFFYGPLGEIDAVVYRQEVFQDIEDRDVLT
jgi:DNA mismatch repair protein MutS